MLKHFNRIVILVSMMLPVLLGSASISKAELNKGRIPIYRNAPPSQVTTPPAKKVAQNPPKSPVQPKPLLDILKPDTRDIPCNSGNFNGGICRVNGVTGICIMGINLEGTAINYACQDKGRVLSFFTGPLPPPPNRQK